MEQYIKSENNEALLALIGALDARDAYRRDHIARYKQVEFISCLLKSFKLDATLKQQICNAVLLHDVGMIGISDDILLKPGALDSDEKKIITQAPQIAMKILANVPSLAAESKMILHQNENWDGSGYPDNLKGTAIPVGSRFISVARAINAMTHHRAYRPSRPISYCLEELQANAGKQFDPTLAKASVKLLCKGGVWTNNT